MNSPNTFFILSVYCIGLFLTGFETYAQSSLYTQNENSELDQFVEDYELHKANKDSTFNLQNHEIDQMVTFINLNYVFDKDESLDIELIEFDTPFDYSHKGTFTKMEEGGDTTLYDYEDGWNTCTLYLWKNRKDMDGNSLKDYIYKIEVRGSRIKNCGFQPDYSETADGEYVGEYKVSTEFHETWLLDQHRAVVFHYEYYYDECCIPSCTADFGGEAVYYYKSNPILSARTDDEGGLDLRDEDRAHDTHDHGLPEEEYEETLFGKLYYLLVSEAYEYHIHIQEASPEIKSHLKTPARIIELWEN